MLGLHIRTTGHRPRPLEKRGRCAAAWIGRLPGDIRIERGNWIFYFPLATSLLLSVLFTILFSFFSFFDRR